MYTETQLFDRKFITAAIMIGGFYAAIVVGLGSLLGKEAAGVASVALAALATGIFKQFETLRFRQLAEQEGRTIAIPQLDWWYILLLGLGYIGIQLFAGILVDAVLLKFNLLPNSSSIESFFDLLSDRKILIGAVGLNSVTYFAGGFVCGKTAPSVRYTYALIGCFLALIANTLIPILGMALQDTSSLRMFLNPQIYVFCIFWLLYFASSLVGARLGFAGTSITSTHEA